MRKKTLSATIDGIQYDTENHLESFRYVSDQIEEFLLDERESGREDSVSMEHM